MKKTKCSCGGNPHKLGCEIQAKQNVKLYFNIEKIVMEGYRDKLTTGTITRKILNKFTKYLDKYE